MQISPVSILNGPGDMPDTVWLFVARIVGAIAGSAISIAYVFPRGKREALIRLLVGIGVGMIFGPAAGHVLARELGIGAILSATETTLSGSAAASLCAWWVLGILARISRRHALTVEGAGN